MKILTAKVIKIGSIPKTITVEVETVQKHPLYKKILKKHKKYLVDDEKAVAKIGQTVKIIETAPISKNKSFKLQ